MSAAAPAAGSADATSGTSPGSTPPATSVPKSRSAKKLTALGPRNSAAWRWSASSPGTPMRRMTYAPNRARAEAPGGRAPGAAARRQAVRPLLGQPEDERPALRQDAVDHRPERPHEPEHRADR